MTRHSGNNGGRSHSGYRAAPSGEYASEHDVSIPRQGQFRSRHIRSREAPPSPPRKRYLDCGIPMMILGLVLYFGGGYLFITAYNGFYPFLGIVVDDFIIKIYFWVGPITFFMGVVIFVGSYAFCCRGVKCNGSPNSDAYEL